jgi:integrase
VLSVVPVIETPKVENRRTGFFEVADFAALLVELPAVLRPLIQFLKLTGWRRDEGRLLLWANVDRDGGVLRLDAAASKTGEPRIFPYAAVTDLQVVIDERWAARDGLFVFHDAGEPIGVGKLRSGWKRATKRAGLDGRLVHDLRRTAARDMRRAGLAESDIMALCGWESLSMFQRYAIRDEAALATAAAKLNYKVPTKSEPSTPSSPSISSGAAT